MSSPDYIETHITPGTTFNNLAQLANALEALNDFDPSSHAGPSYTGFLKLTKNHLGLYESDEDQDTYMTRLRVYCDPAEIAKEMSKELDTGEVMLLDLPEGNPASVYRITPGKVDKIVNGQKANWGM